MQQYFINAFVQLGDEIPLSKEQSHHIAHVMRMKINDKIRIVDEHAHIFFATIAFENNMVVVKIVEAIEDKTINKVSLTLAQGLLKGDKWDYLLQKSAELGVKCIVPFVSTRCVVKTKDDKIDKKMTRWKKILIEACEQCKRSTLVDLKEPVTFESLLSYNADVKLIAYEGADIVSERLCDVLKTYPNVQSVLVVVGCEGGFAKEEVNALEACGYHRISLGARILRAETAALSLLSTIPFYYDMEGEQS